MALCQIKRGKDGEVEEVLAANGRKSIAYQSLLDSVNKMDDISTLQKQFKGWEGKHIQSVDRRSDIALALYKQLYSPAFKSWFGNWKSVAQARSLADNIKGIYKDIFKQDPEQALHEAAIQANSSPSERKGAISTFGEEIVKHALELFPNAKPGDKYTPSVSKVVDENGEPLVVYHGTSNTFDTFDKSKLGSTTGKGKYVNKKTGEEIPIDSEKGFFFTSDKMNALSYSYKGRSNQINEELNALETIARPLYKSKETIENAIKYLKQNPYYNNIIETAKKEGKSNKDIQKIFEKIYNEQYPKLEDSRFDKYFDKYVNWQNNNASDKKVANNLLNNVDKLLKGDPTVENRFGNFLTHNAGIGNYSNIFYDKSKKEYLFVDSLNKDRFTSKEATKERITSFLNNALKEIEKSEEERKAKMAEAKYLENTIPVFLNMKNPLIHDYEGSSFPDVYKKGKYDTSYVASRQVNKAAKEGHDGVIYKNIVDPLISDNYGVFEPNQIKSISNEGYFTQSPNIFKQAEVQEAPPKAATPASMKSIDEFLDRIGVEVKELKKIAGANGIAIPLEGLILVAEGKRDIALPEEAMHMAVELIAQKNPKLFKEMMDKIGNYDILTQVIRDYKDDKNYQNSDGKPNIPKLKKEAIGKLLAQTIIEGDEALKESKNEQVKSWWQRILEFLKNLFLKADFNPFEKAAKDIKEGKENLGNIKDLKQEDTSFFQTKGNPNAVDATMKVAKSLQDPRAVKWFKDLYEKGNKDTFFDKLQKDLQAPKQQVEMLKKWAEANKPTSVNDMITGVLADMSYTVEVNVAKENRERDYDPTDPNNDTNYHIPDIRNTQHYSNMTVPGGINYRENEIATPGIVPSIKGHAAFSTEKGIGWFRSDDKVDNAQVLKGENLEKKKTLLELWGNDPKYKEILSHNIEVFNSRETGDSNYGGGILRDLDTGKEYHLHPDDLEPLLDFSSGNPKTDYHFKQVGGTPTNTRRILEVQSDLFQKGRNNENLVWNQKFANANISEGLLNTYKDEDKRKFLTNTERNRVEEFLNGDKTFNKEIEETNKQKQFLQLLNKDNNWVTFFVKSIIQDSAKKGYESVLFPKGDTAAKVEGHETVDVFIKNKQARVDALDALIKGLENSEIREESDERGKFYRVYINGRATNSTYLSKTIAEKKLEVSIVDKEHEKDQLQKEIENAKVGKLKISSIANFYETTIKNILDKHGYKPETITDEHGNSWYKVTIDHSRDLNDIYYQLNKTETKLDENNKNISIDNGKFKVNGKEVPSVQDKINKMIKDNENDLSEERKQQAEYKRQAQNRVVNNVKRILDRYIDDDHSLRDQPKPGGDGYNPEFYEALDNYVHDKLSKYETGTKFYKDINVYDGVTAGNIDLLAISPSGKTDIFKFKLIDFFNKDSSSLPKNIQKLYNTEIESLRSILERGYEIKRKNLNETRVIPIKPTYMYKDQNDHSKGINLIELTIGNANVDLIKDESLLPFASTSESTGNEKLDKFIGKLQALLAQVEKEKVTPEQYQEKKERIIELNAGIRSLKILKDVTKVIESGKLIIANQEDKYKSLSDRLDKLDPTFENMNKMQDLAKEIMDDLEEVKVYKNLYPVTRNLLKDKNDADSQKILDEASRITNDATDMIEKYFNLSVKLRTEKLAAMFGIKDEFKSEKLMSWWTRMGRSLSQGETKAARMLWELISLENNIFDLTFQDRISDISRRQKAIKDWLKGRPDDEFFDKIYAKDKNGHRTGGVIKKFSEDFYKDLQKAQDKNDIGWVRNNIDTKAYNDWYNENLEKQKEYLSKVRWAVDNAENQKIIDAKLDSWVNKFDISTKVNPTNWKLKSFPLDKWHSDGYKELQKPGNEPVLEEYNKYQDLINDSHEIGMIESTRGGSFFPSVRKSKIEKLMSGMGLSLLDSFRVDAQDKEFGSINELTGKEENEIVVRFKNDLAKEAKDTNGNYFNDISEQSMEYFKVLALWEKERMKYIVRNQSVDLAKLLLYTEAGEEGDLKRQAIKTGFTGKIVRKAGSDEPILIDNNDNVTYLGQHIDAFYFGKGIIADSDIRLQVTGRDGKKITLSGTKAILAVNHFFVSKTLGLNLTTSLSNIIGGIANTYINAGKFFTKLDILNAEKVYFNHLFWKDDRSVKLAGLIQYLHPYIEDKTEHQINHMNLNDFVKYLSGDHLFYLQRGSDNYVNRVIAISFIENSMVKDGKIVNIREFARQELGHGSKYEKGAEGAKEFDKKLEERVQQLKDSPEALINHAKLEKDANGEMKLVLPGFDKISPAVFDLRNQILNFIKVALGNTSREDLSLYKRYALGQSLAMFKNWIPRLVDERFKGLVFNQGSHQWEEGRIRGLVKAILHFKDGSIENLLKLLGGSKDGMIDMLKKMYEEEKQKAAEEEEDYTETEAEFVDRYLKAVRSGFKELSLALALISMMVAARLMTPDKEDSYVQKGMFKWTLRALDKFQDEITFFYNPKSFTDIVNGSAIPSIGMLLDIQRFFTTGIGKLWYTAIGDEKKAAKEHPLKNILRVFPGIKELLTYLAIFDADIAKEYGLKVSSQNGSSR